MLSGSASSAGFGYIEREFYHEQVGSTGLDRTPIRLRTAATTNLAIHNFPFIDFPKLLPNPLNSYCGQSKVFIPFLYLIYKISFFKFNIFNNIIDCFYVRWIYFWYPDSDDLVCLTSPPFCFSLVNEPSPFGSLTTSCRTNH